MAIAARFAANVIGCRQALGISQEELGVRASVHRTEVSQIERGLRLPRIDTLAKLCGSLGVEPNVLMAGDCLAAGRNPSREFQAEANSQAERLLSPEPTEASRRSARAST